MNEEIPGYRPLRPTEANLEPLSAPYEPRAVWQDSPWPTQTGARRDLVRAAMRDEAQRSAGVVVYLLLAVAAGFAAIGWYVVGNWAMVVRAWPWR